MPEINIMILIKNAVFFHEVHAPCSIASRQGLHTSKETQAMGKSGTSHPTIQWLMRLVWFATASRQLSGEGIFRRR